MICSISLVMQEYYQRLLFIQAIISFELGQRIFQRQLSGLDMATKSS